MEPGDILVLYSDGVTEAMDEENVEFGEERLVAFLKKNRAMDPERLVEALIRAVHEFSKDGKPGDDVTVAVIRRD
jgi:phosphoserine phosphatase RsbU/P